MCFLSMMQLQFVQQPSMQTFINAAN